jgi:hypothetical protein
MPHAGSGQVQAATENAADHHRQWKARHIWPIKRSTLHTWPGRTNAGVDEGMAQPGREIAPILCNILVQLCPCGSGSTAYPADISHRTAQLTSAGEPPSIAVASIPAHPNATDPPAVPHTITWLRDSAARGVSDAAHCTPSPRHAETSRLKSRWPASDSWFSHDVGRFGLV